MERKYSEICTYVLGIMGKDGSHGMDHVLRVTRLCRIIGRKESADMAILVPAALLHDIARPQEKATGIPHETEGARLAGLYLASIGYPEQLIPAISDAISTHRFRSTQKPGTLEAQILSDADKLDAMGAVGIARTFMRAAEHGGNLDDAVMHFHDKLLHLHERMYTRTAQEIAQKRHALLVLFLSRLEEEQDISLYD
nr:HD domain-containing protein [uncultured Methanoregula sp.]